MKEILDLAANDIPGAFLSLWHRLGSNYPNFQEAEQATLRDKEQHAKAKARFFKRLMENSGLMIRNFGGTLPLAILEAMDKYLFLRFGTKYDAPPLLIKHGNARYIICRRMREINKYIPHSQQTGHLRSYMPHHRIIPENINGFTISVQKAPLIGRNPKQLLKKRKITAYVGTFQDGVTPTWNQKELPHLLAEGLTDRECRWQSIETALKEADRSNADIVVLPELSVCPELRDRISLWLDDNPHYFSYVLPGTFHFNIDGSFYNFAELFNPNGRPILSHCKLTTFGTREKYEKISTGNRISLLDTAIGLIGMPICLDFCEEASPFADLWEKIGADWFLVPSFGGESNISAHKRRAATLHRAHGAVTVLSNQPDTQQPPSGKKKAEDKHGFVCSSNSPEFVSPKKRFVSIRLKKILPL